LIYVAETPELLDGRLFDIVRGEKSNVFVIAISYFDAKSVENLLTSPLKDRRRTKDSIKTERRLRRR
jgi:hypothetical protein